MGFSYGTESASNSAIIWKFGKELECWLWLWYQLLSGVIMRVEVWFGSCLAVRRAQCSACCDSSSLWGCAIPLPIHLWLKAFPKDPNILSLLKRE